MEVYVTSLKYRHLQASVNSWHVVNKYQSLEYILKIKLNKKLFIFKLYLCQKNP